MKETEASEKGNAASADVSSHLVLILLLLITNIPKGNSANSKLKIPTQLRQTHLKC